VRAVRTVAALLATPSTLPGTHPLDHSMVSGKRAASTLPAIAMKKHPARSPATLTLAHPGASRRALRHLRRTDPVLAKLIAQVGRCGYQLRADGAHFDHLVRAIVYQQLAGKAAATIYGRVQALYSGRPPTAGELASTSAARLRRAGLSRQKLGYLKDLARRVATGRLALDALDSLPDEAVIEALTAIRGVGVWTAQMFLMFRLGRLDVLPVLDLGIQKGIRRTYSLRGMPTAAQMARIAAGWSPYRSVACWYLWRAAERPDPPPRAATVHRARPAPRARPKRRRA